VYLDNYKDSMTREEMLTMGITLQHEAYRDGIVDARNTVETQQAVTAHTEMAFRMAGDNHYTGVMTGIINGNRNLQQDIGNYMTAKMSGDMSAFNAYVDGAYGSSADYWKLVQTEDGSYGFSWDGHLNIYGMNGNQTDPNEDLLVKYGDIEKLLQENEGKDTITLSKWCGSSSFERVDAEMPHGVGCICWGGGTCRPTARFADRKMFEMYGN
jgi:hypothetical protein